MLRRSLLIICLCLLFLVFSLDLVEGNLSYLTFQRYQVIADVDIHAQTYGSKDGIFVLVGDGGYIATSPDGQSWTQSTSRTDADLKGVTYKYSTTNQLYVAVGSSGTIVASEDGYQWYPEPSVTDKNLKAITNRAGLFVAVGQEGVVLWSNQRGKWNEIRLDTKQDLNSVVYGNDTFVAVGNSGVIFISADGKSWESVQSPVSKNLKAVTFGNGIFCAVGYNGAILRSLDGYVWVEQESRTGSYLSGVGFGDNYFFAVGQGGSLMFSNDCVTWNRLYTGTNIWLKSVIFRNNILLANGYGGNTIRAFNSKVIATPSFLNFGKVDVGSTITQSFAVINIAEFPITISSVSLNQASDRASQFSINDLCTGNTLQRSQSCRIDVTYTSGSAYKDVARIDILTTDPNIFTNIGIAAESVGVLYTLQVNVQGSGSVYSSPSGIINCRSGSGTCSSQFLSGTNITLFAIPDSNNNFSQWTGMSGCTTGNPCSFTITSNTNINAQFVAP
ncbi:MAG: hypothetical protein N3A62_01305 [Thermodesulfovibrionales bacterium]|nr:hypothetical protein [Thermodesulfovibrionales bacterium]